MRLFMLLLLALPIMAAAQINRSASELARENIEAYLKGKIFRTEPYRSYAFGTLKPTSITDTEVVWMMDHRFGIAEKNKNESSVWKPYFFVFYFDKKMKIVMTKSSWSQ